MNLNNKILSKRVNTKLDASQLEYILNPLILREWAAFSLTKRCTMIKAKFNIEISRITLAKYYKKNRVKYIKPDYTIYSE